MLTPYRRHRADCKHRSRRYKGCSCPIWVQGVLHDATIRRSLDLTSWEAANRKIRELEIHGDAHSVSLSEAIARFMDDIKAAKLSAGMIAKYQNLTEELKAELGDIPVRSVTID